MDDGIANASSIKEIHLAHRRAVRRIKAEFAVDADALRLAIDTARDEALAKLQEASNSNSDKQDPTNLSQAHQIHPQIFLGPFAVAQHADTLRRLEITHILCLSAEGPSRRHQQSGVIYLEHPLVEMECTLEDGARQLAEILPSCFAFVQGALQSRPEGLRQTTMASQTNQDNNHPNKVLIHCLHGKTRSAAIATCIIAKLSGHCNFDRAYQHVKSCRDVCVPRQWHSDLQRAIDHLPPYEE